MDAYRTRAASLAAACWNFALVLAVSLAACLAVASPATAQASDLPDLAARVIDAVVNISTKRIADGDSNPGDQAQRRESPGTDEPQRPQRSLGSGFVIDRSGIIVTNEHVIRDAEEIDVILNDGTRLPAELL